MSVTKLPVVRKDTDKVLTLAERYTGCQHLRATVDERLAEVICNDCGAKLNAIQYLVTLAKRETMYEFRLKSMKDHMDKLDERKRCRCTKCGEWTEIRRVGARELKRIKGAT